MNYYRGTTFFFRFVWALFLLYSARLRFIYARAMLKLYKGVILKFCFRVYLGDIFCKYFVVYLLWSGWYDNVFSTRSNFWELLQNGHLYVQLGRKETIWEALGNRKMGYTKKNINKSFIYRWVYTSTVSIRL